MRHTDFSEQMRAEMDLIESLDDDTLNRYARSYIYLQFRAEKILQQISNEDEFTIDEYFDRPIYSKESPHQLIQSLECLTELVRQLANLLKTDKKAMNQLAFDDPGAYAKTLSCRLNHIPPESPLGQYSNNLLSEFSNGKKKSFDRDHSNWLSILESGILKQTKSRVSAHLESTNDTRPST